MPCVEERITLSKQYLFKPVICLYNMKVIDICLYVMKVIYICLCDMTVTKMYFYYIVPLFNCLYILHKGHGYSYSSGRCQTRGGSCLNYQPLSTYSSGSYRHYLASTKIHLELFFSLNLCFIFTSQLVWRILFEKIMYLMVFLSLCSSQYQAVMYAHLVFISLKTHIQHIFMYSFNCFIYRRHTYRIASCIASIASCSFVILIVKVNSKNRFVF